MKKWRLPAPPPIFTELGEFFHFLHRYSRIRAYGWFVQFEKLKDVLVDVLYKKRGRYTRPFLHAGTIAMIFLMVILGPRLLTKMRK